MIKVIDAENITHYVAKEDVVHVELHPDIKKIAENKIAYYGYINVLYKSPGMPTSLYLSEEGVKILPEQIE